MTRQRPDQVASLIRVELASILLRGLKDPRVGLVSVTRVDVSPDLRQAKIFLSPLGDDAARAASMAGLRSALPYLRRNLAGRLGLRYAPELRLLEDDSIAHGAHIADLLRQAQELSPLEVEEGTPG